jgi:hypothetical protein
MLLQQIIDWVEKKTDVGEIYLHVTHNAATI